MKLIFDDEDKAEILADSRLTDERMAQIEATLGLLYLQERKKVLQEKLSKLEGAQ